MNIWIVRLVDGRLNGWIDGEVSEWMDGQTDGQTGGILAVPHIQVLFCPTFLFSNPTLTFTPDSANQ